MIIAENNGMLEPLQADLLPWYSICVTGTLAVRSWNMIQWGRPGRHLCNHISITFIPERLTPWLHVLMSRFKLTTLKTGFFYLNFLVKISIPLILCFSSCNKFYRYVYNIFPNNLSQISPTSIICLTHLFHITERPSLRSCSKV